MIKKLFNDEKRIFFFNNLTIFLCHCYAGETL